MYSKHIYLASPHMSGEGYEQQYIDEAFAANWIAPLGANIDGFEQEMAAFTGAKAAVALSSGTAAIHLALKCAGVEAGDLVFCSTLTFAATVNPILYLGAIPVFIDSEASSWNMSPEALAKAMAKYAAQAKLPKAVIVVHLYGIAANLTAIMEICKRYGVSLIEDAAESLGTKYQGQFTGTFGDYGIYSFNGNKIITSSGGGMLLCNTQDAQQRADKARFWATQARDRAKYYQHSELGYNYRMSNVLAGIGRGQLKVLTERVRQKQAIYTYYRNALAAFAEITMMPIPKGQESNCWLSCILLSDSAPVTPVGIMQALEFADIESRPIWKPMHLQPLLKAYDFIILKHQLQIIDKETGADDSVAGQIFQNGLCLPSDTKMTEQDLNRVCTVIRGLWK